MSSFSEKLAFFNKKAPKEDKKGINIRQSQPSEFSKETKCFLEEINKKSIPEDSKNKKKDTKVINTISQKNKDKSLSQNNNQNKEGKPSKPINEKKEFNSNKINSNIKDKINIFNSKRKEEPKTIKEEEPKIIKGSKIISENPEMIIYQYPNKKPIWLFDNDKILLFIGNNQEQFINAIINIYRDISYEDIVRYKVEKDNLQYNYKIYYIKPRTARYNLVIISLPFLWKEGEFVKDIMNIFDIEKLPKRINYICITLEDKNQIDDKGIITILTIFSLFERKTINYDIIFLFSKEETNYIINEKNKSILFNEYCDLSLSSIFNHQYFFINNKILYEKSENNRTQWNKLDEEIKKIQNIIKSSIALNFDKNKELLFSDIFSNDRIKNLKLKKHFKNLEKTEQIILINYFLFCHISYEISTYILFLYNYIIENEKEISIDDNEIILSKNANLNNTLYMLSKVKFKELKYLTGKNCNLIDTNLNLIKNLFSQNLLQLDLSDNQLKDISIFNKEEGSLSNLYKLDLSYNKIENINDLFNCKFLYLKVLNLSHNEISDINCLHQNLYFNSLEKLDLSFNQIKKMNRIDIKTLNYLDLMNNEISEGFLDFLNDFCYSHISIEKLILIKDNNALKFQYYDSYSPLMDLKYPIEEKNMNEVLKTISFKQIKNLEIDRFNNLEWLSNESLENLQIINFKTKINDLSIFNSTKFTNLKKIVFCNDEPILKGFNSLNIFSLINLVSIKIEKIKNNYQCYLSCVNPEVQQSFIFDNLNFLKEKFLGNNQKKDLIIDISQEILDDKNNWDFFSYNEIINSFPIFKNLKADILDVNYINNKYICKTKFYNHEFRMNFSLDDLKFLNDNELLENLQIINFKTKINDLSIFNSTKFTNLKKIVFCNDEPILKGFNSLNIFSLINLVSIKIEKIKNNYQCYLSCVNPEVQQSFIFDNLNFLKEKFLGNNQKKDLIIDISQEILDDKNNWDFFSYNEIINSFPIFKNLKADILDVDCINNKYICKTKFYNHKFTMNFSFDELNFLNDNMFKEIEELYLPNIIFNDNNIGITKEKFPKIKKLNIKNIIIDSMKFFSEVEYLKTFLDVTLKSNECKNELLEFFEDNKFSMEKITTEGNKIKINYKKPFNFYLFIDKIDKVKYFTGCREIYLNNLQLGDNDIKFLDNKTLFCLHILNLDGNKITNLDILNHIQSLKIENLSLKNNLICSGIESIEKDYKIQSIEVKLKEDDQNNHRISFGCSKKYYYSFFYFDYLCDINKNLDIFKEIKFEKDFRLDLSGIKLKNLNFMENENFKYLSEIVLDNNLIEDISIFEKINYNNKISLKKNPIRKGLHVLKSPFFKCLYLELNIEKKENEYKIFTSFKHPFIDIEFYINSLNEIKNILDFDNNYIILIKNDINESELLENNLLIDKSDLFKSITLFLDFFKNNTKINIVKKTGNFELIEGNDIIFNDNNKQSLEKIFIRFKNITNFNSSLLELNLIDLESDDEELIQCLSFLNITDLKLINCNFNLSILKNFTITNLDLSETTVTDIKGICQLTKLKKLNLSNNPYISNLYELKDAKFKQLKELFLSNDNLEDLNTIKMSEYKFDELEVLDLKNNNIKDITPIKRAFKSLKKLNLKNNNIREQPDFKEMFVSTAIEFDKWLLGTYIK